MSLIGRETFGRLAGIGVLLLGVVGAFFYVGGWFSPHELTQARFVDGFEKVNGVHPGFRRNHAKGVCVTGYFESNGKGTRISKASLFLRGRVPVIGRFSLGTGDPNQADGPGVARGLGIDYLMSDGEEWRTTMINLPVFPFKDPQAFYDNMIASAPDPVTHQPDPAKQAAFMASHPETAHAIEVFKSHEPSSGFDNTTFYGLTAFIFTNEEGKATPVRWTLVPEQLYVATSAAGTPSTDKNYLFLGVIASILQHPLKWHLILTLGEPGDSINNSTSEWPAGREQVDVGTLTLNGVEAEATSDTRVVNFDPLVLPAGISPSHDPLLSARSGVYSESFTRRAGEKAEPSAITPADIRK
ncbi:MAG: catalase family peroxidase [Candidatus Acidiferrum sp.]